MKKFMKAIAFVTVMCMALSTVAFAANGAVKSETDDKTVIVTVTEAGANEQVALYIVAKGGTTASDPLFIDQQQADQNGDTIFTAKIAGEVDAVKVFVGYAANTTNSAVDLGEVELEEAITKITVTRVSANRIGTAQAESDIGEAWSVAFNVEAPQGSTVTATNMIWAITYTDEVNNVTDTVYSKAVDASSYGIGAVMDGAVTLAVAFNNGSIGRDLESVKIDSVDAIFLFSNDSEVATNSAHMSDKKTVNTPVTE